MSRLTADEAHIAAHAGEVRIRLEQVTAAKLVLASRRDVLELEEVAARGWSANEVLSLDGWLLRAASGWTRRANSALPLRTPQRPLRSLLAEVTAWYAERGLPARIQVPMPARELLDHELGALGWTTEGQAVVLSRTRPAAQADGRVALHEAPSPQWLASYPELAPAGFQVLNSHPQVRYASVLIDGELVARARGAVDCGWLGLSAIWVCPGHRRQGLGTALIETLADWARTDYAAEQSYLAVELDNLAARNLYASAGFHEHHCYHYRRYRI